MTGPKQLLESLGIAPKKSLGQNFLHDPNTLNALVEAAQLPENATVLEIGPGTGVLTERLARVAGRVIAVEADERLRPILEKQLTPFHNVTLCWMDFLQADVDELVGTGDFYVVANLPYYITSPILRKLLEAPHRPRRLVLTVQKEVADRIVAKPGDMGILSVSVQFYGTPQAVMRLNPAVFWPRPEVESAVVRIDVHDAPLYDVPSAETLFRIVRAGFGQKRKQLKNSLASGLGISNSEAQLLLERAGIEASRRAETLSLEEWAALARQYANG